MKTKNQMNCPVAIVGMSAIFPGSADKVGFWQDILSGKDQIKEVPASHWLINDYYDENPKARDKTYGKRGGFLPDVVFDPLAFGLLPNALEATDSGQLLALLVAKQVLEDAYQGQFNQADKSKISVILGTTGSTELVLEMAGRMERPKWVKALREEGLDEDRVQSVCDRIASQYVEWQESSFPGLLPNIVAGRIAHRLDLGGTNFIADAACASSLSALGIGLNELYLGQSDLVITGGVDAFNTISMYMCFSKTPALSPTEDCRPFADNADGTMLSEGVGMIAIKRLADAQRDGDQVYAVIKALGASSDGKGKSVYAPVPEGQARCLQRAYELAGYEPSTIELLEAHGTATKAGDTAEFEGLSKVFKSSAKQKNWCALGSVKSNIGHAKAAAGIAGLMKAVLALNHKILPSSIKIDQPQAELNLQRSAFYLNTETRPWIRGLDHPRRAGVSSFGFGGTNFHVTVEEYQHRQEGTDKSFLAPRSRTFESELFLYSADDPAKLAAASDINDKSFRFLAAESRQGFNASQPHRLAVVAIDARDLKQKLGEVLAYISGKPDQSIDLPNGCYYGVGQHAGKLGYLFSGQGSQYLNMGADIAMSFDCARAAWDQSADLEIWDGANKLHQMVFPNPVFTIEDRRAQENSLRQTEWAQPAIAAVGLSQLNIMHAVGLQADGVAGHSLGELTALHAAGVFDQESLLKIARQRGLLMHQAAKVPGAMLAVFASAEMVEDILSSRKSKLVIANFNTPRQVILAGSEEDVSGISEVLKQEGVSVKLLPVSTAFHSKIVSSAVAPFKKVLAEFEFSSASRPVFSNLNGGSYPDKPSAVRKQLGEQIKHPVHFSKQVDAMYAAGIRDFIELGPNAVLTGLVSDCLCEREHSVTALDKKGSNGVTQLWHAFGKLSARGYGLNLGKLLAGYAKTVDPASLAVPKMAVIINGSNYGKLYPPREGESVLPKPNAGDRKIDELEIELKQQYLDKQLPQAEPSPIGSEASANSVVDGGDVISSNNAQALREVQGEISRVQLEFQSALAESHRAFLNTSDLFITSMTQAEEFPRQIKSTSTPLEHVAQQVMPVAPMSSEFAGTATAESVADIEPAGVSERPDEQVPAGDVEGSDTDTPNLENTDIKELTLQIVAEKTGYPREMLNLDMHLENDLGIDSIKRVEILAALTDQAPNFAEPDTSELVKLSTLADITAFIDQAVSINAGVSIASNAADSIADRQPADLSGVAATVEVSASDMQTIMLNVVAEKTGYPQEMLNLDMHLENDLGIDSIKRVEILAALIDQVPSLPDFDNNELTKLSTLAEIVDFINRTSELSAVEDIGRSTSPVIEFDADEFKVERLALEWCERAHLGFQTCLLQAGETVVISEDQHGVSEALAAKFEALDCIVQVTDDFNDKALLDARVVVFLGGLNQVGSAEDAMAINKDAFGWAKAVADGYSERGGVFVTVQDTGGQFLTDPARAEPLCTNKEHRALLGGLAGLAKTAALEWPQAQVKAIDIERGGRKSADIAVALIDEIVHGGLEREVGLRVDGERGTLVNVPSSATMAAGFDMTGDAVIVASGGAKGVTAASLIKLAQVSKPRIALLGRSVLVEEAEHLVAIGDETSLKAALLEDFKKAGQTITPIELNRAAGRILTNREIKRNIQRMEAAGSTVRYYNCDIGEKSSTVAVLNLIRDDWGAITGLVHGAGVIADKLITDKTDEQFDSVLRPKVEGLMSLLSATANDPLKLICLFSSVAGRWGNSGQADYAMANEILNKVAVREYVRRQGRCLVKSINWGPWDSGMVDAALRQQFHAHGIRLISLAEGAEKFAAEIAGSSPSQIEVVVGKTPQGLGRLLPETKIKKQLIVNLELEDYTFLDGHQIQGKSVVPYVVVADWITRACQSNWPQLHVYSIDNFRCLKGISLNKTDRRITLSIEESTGPGAKLQVGIGVESPLGEHFSAAVTLTAEPGKTHEKLTRIENLEAWPLDYFYDGEVLFHQAPFKVIADLKGINSEGIEAALVAETLGPLADSLILDGGLQIVGLWVWKYLGGGPLPMSIGSIKKYTTTFNGHVLATAKVNKTSNRNAVVDVFFHDDEGNILAEINSLEVVIYFEKPFAGSASELEKIA